MLVAQFGGNLSDAILKLTVGITERLSSRQRRQFVRRPVLFRPATQESNGIADVGARTIDATADQLELGDQSVVALQKLIALLGESLVESLEQVDPASQAGDFRFEPVHGVFIFGVLAPQLIIVLLEDCHQIVVIASQFF